MQIVCSERYASKDRFLIVEYSMEKKTDRHMHRQAHDKTDYHVEEGVGG